jgi:xylulokinase
MPLERLVALGGGSASGVWCQLMADILRRPLLVAQEAESTCLGSGMLAAAAAGIHPSIPDAARAMSSTGAEYVPDDARAKTYDGFYNAYRKLYPQLKEVFADLKQASG